jgi:hypothetical protein
MKNNYNWHMTFALVSKANNRNRSIRYRMRSFQNLSLVRRQPIINPNGVAVFCYGKEPFNVIPRLSWGIVNLS